MVKVPFNKITNVPLDVFENLENLEVLDLSYNHVQKVKMPMKNLGRLTQLNMHVNNFTDFPSQLPRALRVLILEQNKIRSIKRRSLGTDMNFKPKSRHFWSNGGFDRNYFRSGTRRGIFENNLLNVNNWIVRCDVKILTSFRVYISPRWKLWDTSIRKTPLNSLVFRKWLAIYRL